MTCKKKISLFVALLSLFYSVSLIQTTYAKYVTTAEANSNINIARWNITVNNQDVIENSNFIQNLSPVFNGTTYIKENVIAPTSEGYFDILIDGTNTDVSFQYTITINPSDANTIKDLKIVKYTINNVDYNYIDNISGDINFDDENKNVAIRVFIMWNDEESTQEMNNNDDTIATVEGNANYKINVNLIQIRN